MIGSLLLTLTLVSQSVPTSFVNRETVLKGATLFQRVFLEQFEQISQYSLAKQGFDEHVKPKLTRKNVDIGPLAEQFIIKLRPFLDEQIEALRKIVQTSEKASYNLLYTVNYDSYLNRTTNRYLNVKNGDLFFNRTTMENIDRSEKAGVHIPVEIFFDDPAVVRDIGWTNSKTILETFQSNAQTTSGILRQYVATETGITNIYPAKPWLTEPKLITIDLFDPRYRTWYVSAVSAPKDILFLLDSSGSVHGQTLRLMKMSLVKILTLLTPNDYINGIWYSKLHGTVMEGCFEGFLPATTRNKLIFQRYLDRIRPEDQAQLSTALNYTFMEFSKIRNTTSIWEKRNHRSGGHQLLFLMTDGIEDWSIDVINHYAPPNGDKTRNTTIRIFGMAMGFGTGFIDALRWMACTNNGYYSLINSLADVKHESRAFIPVLSRPLALSLQNVDIKERPVSWTGPYMDAQGQGALLTISMPILNKMFNGSDQSFLGVAAIDIKLSTIERMVDESQLGFDSYTFAIDNNGIVLFHPKLVQPEPDVQLIRRTGCYDAYASRTAGSEKFSGTARVIFPGTNEAIVQQMGLLDSIFTNDLAEIEPGSENIMKLRKAMINQTCTSQIYKIGSGDKRLLYTCRNVPNTPYSIAVAAKNNAFSIEYTDPRSNGELGSKFKELTTSSQEDLVSMIFPPKVLCSGTLDLSSLMTEQRSVPSQSWPDRIDAVCALGGDQTTQRLLADFEASDLWRTFWPKLSINGSCVDYLKEKGRSEPIWHFLQTASGLTFVYPRKCHYDHNRTLPKALNWKKKTSPLFAKASSLLRNEISVQMEDDDTLLLWKPIINEGHLMAIAGFQVARTFMDDVLRNFTSQTVGMQTICRMKDSDPKQPFNSGLCHLVNRNLNLVASMEDIARNRLHLGYYDPIIFDHLFNYSRIDSQKWIDYQANCPRNKSRLSLFISAANPLEKPFQVVMGMLSNFLSFLTTCFWVEFWSAVTSLKVTAGQILATTPKPDKETIYVRNCPDKYKYQNENTESCILEHYSYVLKIKPNQTIEATSRLGCSRKYYIVALNDTNLSFMVSDFPCRPCKNGCYRSFLPLSSKTINECETVKIRYRRRPQAIYTTFHPLEDDSACGLAAIHKMSLLIVILALVLLCKL